MPYDNESRPFATRVSAPSERSIEPRDAITDRAVVDEKPWYQDTMDAARCVRPNGHHARGSLPQSPHKARPSTCSAKERG